MAINIKPAAACELDMVSLGEAMIRLSPPAVGRIEFANLFEAWVGGGEYNVAYALARLGARAGWIGALVENPVAKIILNHARAAGLDLRHVVNMPFDGVGREARVGLNFTEVGAGPRPSVTMYDRGHSATSKLKPGDIDWQAVFAKRGVRWFHSGGIFTALSNTTRQVILQAVQAAKANGTFVSYDLNFRASLWSIKDAIAATAPLTPHIDGFIGNIGQFEIVLGEPVKGFDLAADKVEPWAFEALVEKVTAKFKHVKLIATTMREVRSSSVNDFWCTAWVDGAIHHSRRFDNLELEDRVGGGDGFAAGMIYGLLQGLEPRRCLDLGAALAALVMSTRGDTSMVGLAEVEHLAGGGSAKIVR